MKHCLIFSCEIFCFTIVAWLNVLWLKAVNEITADYTTRQSRKHGVVKVCSTEYLNVEIELVLHPTFKSWTVHKIAEYLTLELLELCHIILWHFLTVTPIVVLSVACYLGHCKIYWLIDWLIDCLAIEISITYSTAGLLCFEPPCMYVYRQYQQWQWWWWWVSACVECRHAVVTC